MTPQPIFAKHASDAGNSWYDRFARRIEEVPKADGKGTTPCTLKHARKLDLARGHTSIIRNADKPQLTEWRVQQGILAALTLPRFDTETDAAYVARVMADSKEGAKKAAEEGTRVHAAVQAHFQGQLPVPEYAQHVEGIVRCLIDSTGVSEWQSEQAFVSPLGYGAKLDLMGGGWIVDLKGKENVLTELQKLTTYDEHAQQLAAQRHAANLPHVRCGILFFSRTQPGAAHLVEVSEEELQRGMRMFRALLRYTFEKDGWRPTWATEEA